MLPSAKGEAHDVLSKARLDQKPRSCERPRIFLEHVYASVSVHGELLTCPPAEVLPMAQRYFMY